MPWEPLPGGGTEPRPVGLGLDGAVRRLLGTSGRGLHTVFSRWEEVVGPDLARVTSPKRLRGGVLVVHASDAAVASSFRWGSEEVRQRIAALAGEDLVRRIEVVVRPL